MNVLRVSKRVSHPRTRDQDEEEEEAEETFRICQIIEIYCNYKHFARWELLGNLEWVRSCNLLPDRQPDRENYAHD